MYPIAFLICTIHIPERGNLEMSDEKVPTRISTVPIPRAKEKRNKGPLMRLCVVPTQVSRTASDGAVQGEATSPKVRPYAKLESRPCFFAAPPPPMERRVKLIWNTSSMLRPRAMMTAATPNRIHGFALMDPNREPVKAAIKPSAEYVAAMPKT